MPVYPGRPPEPTGGEPQRVEIDEKWIGEYVDHGLNELRRRLGKQDAFERWLRDHPEHDDPQEPSTKENR